MSRFFAALVATTGNSFFVAVLLRSRALLRDPHMILLLTLAVCDLGISVFGFPYTVASSFAGEWLFGDHICQIYAFSCFTLSMVIASISHPNQSYFLRNHHNLPSEPILFTSLPNPITCSVPASTQCQVHVPRCESIVQINNSKVF